MKKFHLFYIHLVIVTLAGISGCTNRSEHEETSILARVGDEVITADEFRMSYEFGHAHLRTGDDPKRRYLTLMMYEAALAQEAEKQGLDTLTSIQNAMHVLKEELLIERVFDHSVLSKIEVSEEEIRAEINKSAVQFQFRFMPAASRAEAKELQAQIVAQGYEAVLEERKAAMPELAIVEGQLTSPLLKAEDIDAELLAVISNLPLHTPSEPVRYGSDNVWYVFEVIDIRRIRLAPEDYIQKSSTYQKVIYNRKAMEQGGAFVQQTMEPLNVRTKRNGFESLHNALFAWYSEQVPERSLKYYIDVEGLRAGYVQQLVAEYDTPLVEFGGKQWTIEDFVDHFTPGRYILRAEREDAFKARLADIVALVVRDKVLFDIAADEALENNPDDERNLHIWRAKWLALEYKNVLRSDSTRTWSPQDWDEFARDVLDTYAVDVNWTMLDTMHVAQTASNTPVYLLKSNSNKQPFPIVDPDWGSVR